MSRAHWIEFSGTSEPYVVHPRRRLGDEWSVGMRSLLVAAAALLAPGAVDADAGRPFAPVFEGVVAGDLLLIGNSNLLSAGGWSVATDADVDGDDTRGRAAETGR